MSSRDSTRGDGLDHRYTCDLVVGSAGVLGAFLKAGADGSVAARTQWRVTARRHRGLGFIGRVHHWNDEVHCSRVEHASDDALLIPRHAHGWCAGAEVHGLQHRDGRAIVGIPVLHVDTAVVPSDASRYLCACGIGQSQPRAVGDAARTPQCLHRVCHAVTIWHSAVTESFRVGAGSGSRLV